jgi:large subunit ribosomal protein L5
MNNMEQVRIEKLTLNIGSGKDQGRLAKATALIKKLTGKDPIKTRSKKRIPAWGLRPGLPIGCKLTLRKKPAHDMLKLLLEAKDKVLKPSQFDACGNVSFGIHEYIDIPNLEYDPDIGVMGLEVCLTLEKPGTRIKRRKLLKKKLPSKQRVSTSEAQDFLRSKFGIQVGEQA